MAMMAFFFPYGTTMRQRLERPSAWLEQLALKIGPKVEIRFIKSRPSLFAGRVTNRREEKAPTQIRRDIARTPTMSCLR